MVKSAKRSASKEPILCYIDGSWAYFTTQSLQKQWGDDWDDKPYEHNAGNPYGPHGNDKPWDIVKVAWDGDLYPPCEGHLNSNWSVKDINHKCVPWLSQPYDKSLNIWAGTKLSRFKKLIHDGGGSVYVEEK